MVSNGDHETAAIDCDVCGREFDCEGTWDVEHHDGYGTRREWFPDDDATCDACKGNGDCEGTFRRDGGDLVPVPCSSGEAKTRLCVEDDGSTSYLGIYCDECARWYDE